ncbi:MAG: hypothetical protein V9H26_18840 [Verrucomicrobiota bacterium]|nr:hypothetical protein [Verrucomicrobiota bacterium]MCC6820708.1 hypothetical protein [Limisphaerales bacterium]
MKIENRERQGRIVRDYDGQRNATPLSKTSIPEGNCRLRFALLSPSKTWRVFTASLLGLTLGIIAHGQSYNIDWFKIAGGGGTSTGGVYSLSGTIGQLDASGPLTNGQYSVTGGFWALPTAIQATNAPTLSIVPATPGNATIAWSPNTPGFVLQETWALSPANWTNSPSGATNPISVPATWPVKFYRLFKP